MPSADSLERTFELIKTTSYQVAAHQAHGNAGLQAVVSVLETARSLFKTLPYEMLTTGVEIVVNVDPGRPLDIVGGSYSSNLSILNGKALRSLTIAVKGKASYQVWDVVGAPITCQGPVISYRYIHEDREVLEIDGVEWNVNDSPWPCAMGTPTFSKLEQALDRYTEINRVPIQCGYLVRSWRDTGRLAFAPKPEYLMRRSLIHALIYALEGATVRPEQNQSETRPVDIEVNWWASRRSAIIEVKWLGASGPVDQSKFTSTYSESRAVEGLRQLAEYLDLRDGTTSDVPVMGYLYVFDARRKNLKPAYKTISRSDGLYYQYRDPEYPSDLLDRADIGRPYRCFIEPVT